MKHVSAGIKLGILILVVAAFAYVIYKQVGESASGAKGYKLYADFNDAAGLAGKSRVVIAGLPVGEIIDRKLVGKKARIWVKVREDVQIFDTAVIAKKSSSLLGEFYLDIDPGMEQHLDGSAARRLKNGDEILQVEEAASAEELMRRVTATMPKVDAVLLEVKGLATDVRNIVKGPISNMAKNLDDTITQDRELVHSILLRADKALSTIDAVAADVSGVTRKGGPQVQQILDNVEDVSKDLKELVAVTKGEIQMTGESVREKLDKIDKSLANVEQAFGGAASIAKKVDEEEGTLGKLVNDPQIGNNIESITTDVASFVKTAFGMQTVVGIRSEYNFVGEVFKTYFSIELQTRADKYYLVEVISDPRFTVVPTFAFGPDNTVAATYELENDFKFSFQFAKRMGPFTTRIGIIESSGGVGGDLALLNGNLTLHADLFDFNFDYYPRLKVAAAYQLFKYLYVYGGVDDAFNDHQSIKVIGTTPTGQDFRYEFGRDVFAGAQLKFNDLDLAAILFVGGAALAGVAGN